MKHVHDYGLKQIGIGLGIIAVILILAGCGEKQPEPIVLEEIVITPDEDQKEEPKDEGNYTEDGRKLPTLKKKYQ